MSKNSVIRSFRAIQRNTVDLCGSKGWKVKIAKSWFEKEFYTLSKIPHLPRAMFMNFNCHKD